MTDRRLERGFQLAAADGTTQKPNQRRILFSRQSQ
jgi:hypothetical protein